MEEKMADKVYCFECRYCYNGNEHLFFDLPKTYLCSHPKVTKKIDTPLKIEYENQKCLKFNKENDCPFYKKKSIFNKIRDIIIN
jgi:hypothetical protein